LFYNLFVLILRLSLVAALITAAWLVYRGLPEPATSYNYQAGVEAATVQIFLRQDQKTNTALDVPIQLYPVDIVAVRHEFFAERRAGERFDDFLNQRMKGRTRINARFDADGKITLRVTPGNWWIHVTLPGEEELEWRLPVTVGNNNQTIELTPRNAYTRTKTF